MCYGYKIGNKGSSTIETALIISAILLILAVLIYASLIMYQKLLLTRTAQYIAQQGAEYWSDSTRNLYDGSITEKGDDISFSQLYYHLLDDSIMTGRKIIESIDITSDALERKNYDNQRAQDQKLNKIKAAVCNELSKGLLKPRSTKLEINYTNVFIKRRIDITIQQEIKVPFGVVKKVFDAKSTVTLLGAGTASITEPEEFIRNSDLLIEYVTRTGIANGMGQRINDLREKLKVQNK